MCKAHSTVIWDGTNIRTGYRDKAAAAMTSIAVAKVGTAVEVVPDARPIKLHELEE
jgi:hypothetical protein